MKKWRGFHFEVWIRQKGSWSRRIRQRVHSLLQKERRKRTLFLPLSATRSVSSGDAGRECGSSGKRREVENTWQSEPWLWSQSVVCLCSQLFPSGFTYLMRIFVHFFKRTLWKLSSFTRPFRIGEFWNHYWKKNPNKNQIGCSVPTLPLGMAKGGKQKRHKLLFFLKLIGRDGCFLQAFAAVA